MPSYKRSCKKDKSGYIQIKTKNGWEFEHRMIAEKHIGRKLNKEEVIHHIDENKSNNDIDNLMIFKNNKEHVKWHTKLRQHGMTRPMQRIIDNRWTAQRTQSR